MCCAGMAEGVSLLSVNDACRTMILCRRPREPLYQFAKSAGFLAMAWQPRVDGV